MGREKLCNLTSVVERMASFLFLVLFGIFCSSHALDAPCRMFILNSAPLPLDVCLDDGKDEGVTASRMYKCNDDGSKVAITHYANTDCTGNGNVSMSVTCESDQSDFDKFCFCGSAYSLCTYENRVVYDECVNNLNGDY